MDKRCSGLKARLVDTDFKNNKHLPPPERNDRHKVRLGSVEYKIEYQFCYLGDILSSNCGGGGGSKLYNPSLNRMEEIIIVATTPDIESVLT